MTPAAPRFTDVAAVSGIAFRHASSKTPVKFLPETMAAAWRCSTLRQSGEVVVEEPQGGRAPRR